MKEEINLGMAQLAWNRGNKVCYKLTCGNVGRYVTDLYAYTTCKQCRAKEGLIDKYRSVKIKKNEFNNKTGYYAYLINPTSKRLLKRKIPIEFRIEVGKDVKELEEKLKKNCYNYGSKDLTFLTINITEEEYFRCVYGEYESDTHVYKYKLYIKVFKKIVENNSYGQTVDIFYANRHIKYFKEYLEDPIFHT